MCRCAMIAFIVIVGSDLPIVWAFQLPAMIEVIVLEVQGSVSLLMVDSCEEIIPRYLWYLFLIKVYPYQTVVVNMDMYREVVIGNLVKGGDTLGSSDGVISVAI